MARRRNKVTGICIRVQLVVVVVRQQSTAHSHTASAADHRH